MIGLDTNVLVRYFAQDDLAQAEAATAVLEAFTPEAPGFVSTVSLIETVWVLGRAYGVQRPRIAAVLEGLLRARELVVEDSDVHYLALGVYLTHPVDFADAVIAQSGRRAGCTETLTFDLRAAAGAGMKLLEAGAT